ncbi:hypothetical protein DFH08DRAFT_825677 [Mycena albidolilacea]|uniref:Uncharacterized protein n=1 Tax=Mycena albidolilacea TaxID=1033008 RepID=A0AAD7E975_9AGAR|nr:hypothetical protein DFH08DRAFT_825677 [Mycena albidolilacea]
MDSDPRNHPRVAPIAPGLIPPWFLAFAEAICEDIATAWRAETPHVTGAIFSAVPADDSAAFCSALDQLLQKTVIAASLSAMKTFMTHIYQSETVAAETAAKLQEENSDLRDVVSYQRHKIETLEAALKRADERIKAREERISSLQHQLALKRTARDLESETEEHNEHDGPARPTKRLKTERVQNSLFIPLSFRRLFNFTFAA